MMQTLKLPLSTIAATLLAILIALCNSGNNLHASDDAYPDPSYPDPSYPNPSYPSVGEYCGEPYGACLPMILKSNVSR